MTQISDELLMAYVDGQLDKPQASAVGRMLHEDSDLARRVERIRQTQARLTESFGAMLRNSSSGSLSSLQERKAAGAPRLLQFFRYPLPAAAIAAALIALGIVGSFAVSSLFSKGEPKPKIIEKIASEAAAGTWTEEITKLHAYFSRDTVTAGFEAQANPELVRFQLSKIARKAIPLPDFTKHGLAFNRGQLLNYRGARMMQLLYAGKGEPFVALYILPGGPDQALAAGSPGEVKTVSWSADGVRYILASELPPDALRALGAVAQSQLAKYQ